MQKPLVPLETSISCANHAVLHAKKHWYVLVPIETSDSNVRHAVLHAENHRWGLRPIETCICGYRVAVFTCTKWQVRSVTHIDLLFGSKSRCFSSKNHRWGLGPIETSDSDAKHALVNAQTDRSCLGNLEVCFSGPEVAVLYAKTTCGIFDPQKLVILVLKALFCMHKTTGEVCNP